MVIRRFILLFAIVIAQTVTPISAQDADEHPLLQMLALVPNIPQARTGLLNYADYRAAEEARPGAVRPESWAQLETLMDADDPSALLWFASMPIYSAIQDLSQNFFQLGRMPEVVGFDFFDINRTIYFGNPPDMGFILAGDFDPEAIETALSKRDFTEQELNGLTLWCGPNGCLNGQQISLSDRDLSNPFGGRLGRQEPVIVTSEYVLNSANFAIIEQLASTYAGTQESLADVSQYRAIAEAITQQGSPTQMIFINPVDLMLGNPMVELGLTPDASASEMLNSYGSLPLYQLAAFASLSDETSQSTLIALVYSSAEMAENAGREVVERMSSYTSLKTTRSLPEILEDYNAVIEEPLVVEVGNQAVTLIRLKSPLSPEEPDETGNYIQSDLVYRLLYQMLITRDTYWLQPNLGQ